ncbi:MAG: hypothetical protein CMF46_00685 [Legionellales bacterium]|nr:hypothetical protein [Legionellales bacterium]|tara:strand:+ start:576 stop:1130 length:555 start_codon:yes stop_codon:yes gene_type:complete
MIDYDYEDDDVFSNAGVSNRQYHRGKRDGYNTVYQNDINDRNSRYGPAAVRPVKFEDRLQFFRPGLQYGQLRKLKQKYFMPQRKVDIQDKTLEEARVLFDKFINGCLQHGIRYGMIIHGNGPQHDLGNSFEHNEYPLIKNKVNVWLRDVNEVLAFLSAKEEHGGTGSTYLILKKRSEGFPCDGY